MCTNRKQLVCGTKTGKLRLFLVILLVIFRTTVSGQEFWKQLNGPPGGLIWTLAIDINGDILAGTRGGIMYRSVNNGDSWTPINTDFTSAQIESIVIHTNGFIFLGTSDGAFRSEDNGNNWIDIGNGLSNKEVASLALNSNGDLFAGIRGGGVFRSPDNGDNWTEINNGLTNFNIWSLAVNSNNDIFVGTNGGGIFRSVDNGDSWQEINNGLTDWQVNHITIKNDGQIFAATVANGIFRSGDNGDSWTQTNIGLIEPNVHTIGINLDGEIFAGTRGGGIFRSSNNGNTWLEINKGMTDTDVLSFAFHSNGYIFAGGYGRGVFRSPDNGNSWVEINNGIIAAYVRSIIFNPDSEIFAGTIGGGIYRSSDSGQNWVTINNGIRNLIVRALAINSDGILFAGTSEEGIFRSNDNGSNWIQINNGLKDNTIFSLIINNQDHLFAGTSSGGIFRSTDDGDNWIEINAGLTDSTINCFAINTKGNIFAGTNGGIFRSTDNGENWQEINNGLSVSIVWVLEVNSTGQIFAGTEGGVFRSNDNGENWESINNGLVNNLVVSFAINSEDHCFAGTWGDGIFRSLDNGDSWQEINNGLHTTEAQSFIRALALDANNYIYAGLHSRSIYRSTKPTVLQSVTILSPNGGENLNEDTSYSINWETNSIDSVIQVQLLYSVDNGQTFNTIFDSLSDSGRKTWRIPRTPSNETLVKIVTTSSEGTNLTDISDSVFTIQDVETYIHQTDKISHTIRNDGWSGSGRTLFNPDEPSLEFPPASGRHHLYLQTLAIATINADGDTVATFLYSENYRPSSIINIIDHGNYIETNTYYEDKLGLGIGVDQQTIAFSDDSFVIFNYEIYNDSDTQYSEFYVASFCDFDVNDPLQNRVGYDPTYRLAYMSDASNDWTSYAGLRLLNDDPLAFRRWGADHPTTNGEVFKVLANPGTDDTSGDPNRDYRLIESAGPFNLAPYDLIKVVFVLAVGDGLSGLQTASQYAQDLWVSPTASTGTATEITLSSATLNATVNPNGLKTEVYFEYGETSEYGHTISATENPVTALTEVSVTAQINGLTPGTTYHYKVVASNFVETAYGEDQTFTTTAYPATINIANTVNFPTYTNNSDFKSTEYRIVGLPGSSNLAVNDLFEGEHREDWQCYWDNGAASNYFIEYNGGTVFRFTTGRAFWLIYKGPWNVNRNISSAPLNTQGEAQISLHNGWNLITNPFNSTISWSDVQQANSISEPIWTYNGSFSETSDFAPYNGYYFFNSGNLSNINISYNLVSYHNNPTVNNGDSKEWLIKAKLLFSDNIEETIKLGVSSNSQIGLDQFDARKPRSLGKSTSIYFHHPEWDQDYSIFASDIRPVFTEFETWTFEVNSELREPIQLSLNDIGNVPSHFDVYLIDKDRAKFVNLRSDSNYVFTPAQDIAKFKLFIGKEKYIKEKLVDIVPSQFYLGNNFPNPFNAHTQISVSIPEKSEVSLIIYSILGEKINTIYSGQLSPGRYWFNWNGKNINGTEVSSGVYIYRMDTDKEFTSIKKMLLIK